MNAMIGRSLTSRMAGVLLRTAGISVVLVGCGTGQAGTSASPEPAASARELIDPLPDLYAQASRMGDLVWTAGHLPEGVDVDAPIEEQVNQALDNIEATLEAAGAGFDTVVKANVYITSFDDWEGFNDVFAARLGEFGLPPRSTVAVSELGFGYKVEIEMVAHVRDAGG